MKKRIEIRLKPLEKGQRITAIPINGDLSKVLDEKLGPTAHDVIKGLLNNEKDYHNAMQTLRYSVHDSLPKGIAENCPRCKGEKDGNYDGNCALYMIQMDVTFMMAASAYIDIINANRSLLNDDKTKTLLTRQFFESFYTYKSEGVLGFNLERMSRQALKLGLKKISKLLEDSPALIRLNYINNSIDQLNEDIIGNNLDEKEDESYFELQKIFFEGKQKFYQEKMRLNALNNSNQNQVSSCKKEKKATIVHHALYYLYLQKSGDLPYFENHPEGKVQAIKELVEKEEFTKSYKYFQKVYNKFANYNSNRIALNQISNIIFVAKELLKEYPKAQQIAFEEAKTAQTKNR